MRTMPPIRLLPTDEASALIDLAQDIADGELAPRVDDFEARAEFPRETMRTLGRAGLLGLPYRRGGRGRHLVPAGRRRDAGHPAPGPGADDGPAFVAGGADCL